MRYKVLLSIWLVTDLLLFALAYAAAYFLRVGFILSSDFPFGPYIGVVALAAPLWLLILATTRTFGITTNQRALRTGSYIAYASIVGTALFALSYYFLIGFFFSRLLLIYAYALQVAVVWVWHIAFEKIARSVLRKDPPCFPTLIVGVTRESTDLIQTLNRTHHPLKPVAILDGRGSKEKEIDGVPVLGKLNKLEETLTEKKITHLIQASDLEQSLNLLSACRQKGLTYMLLPSVLGIVERDERIETLEGRPVTVVRPKHST